jgi:glucosyl-dolichyl phosphate glucuronosyltransferase
MPEVSVIISTYNRADSLRSTLESFREQESDGTDYEIIVVDNNSTDETCDVVASFGHAARQLNVYYCFEGTQGVSYARNKGIATARGRLIAFTDDDIRPTPNWISSIRAAFDNFPNVDCIGGKVLPDSETRFPPWLTQRHWTPLALMDLGDKPLELDVQNGPGLIGANLAVRAGVFNDVGYFDPKLQRVKDSIGSMEDHEFLLRLKRADKRIMYVPSLVVHSHVFPERLTKSYHRRWHVGHGRFYAVMRASDFEASNAKLFNVPGHLYRSALSSLYRRVRYRLKNRPDLEFQYQTDLDFFWGFFRQRIADRRKPNSAQNKGEYKDVPG